MRKLMVFCILALVALLAVPAYAEVQNVKVSGDLSARWIVRNCYDLDKNDTGTRGNDTDDYLMSTAEVQVDADLTDNVATVVRLANQRDWGETSTERAGTASNQYELMVDLANVTLKEFVYSPLTLTIGRQDLWFGKGFVIGAKQRDPLGTLNANEYTVINSFDAIKATLDFDPWKVDGVYSVIEENNANQTDDVWLGGLNVGYKFDSYKGEAEAYMFHKHDRSDRLVGTETTANTGINWIGTWGLRGSCEPMANATLAAEGALQFGRYSVNTSDAARSRKAYAIDLSGDYLFKEIKWTPKLGLEYIIYSGENNTTASAGNKWEGWDMMYRGKFDSAIREFQNIYYNTAMRAQNYLVQSNDQDAGSSNEAQLIVIGSVKPTNTLTVDGRFAWFRMMEGQSESVTGQSRSKDIGTELDLSLTYDYTEDVSFSLLAGWFFPGKYWLSGQNDRATDVVGTMKVAF